MDREEREALGDWFNFTTEGVVLPMLTAFVALGAIVIAGMILAYDGLAFGLKFAYNRYSARRA